MSTQVALAASQNLISRGEALAVFNASYTGGSAIRANTGAQEGAPADAFLGSLVTIRPFPPFDNSHYCEEDWHLLVITFLNGPPDVTTHKAAKESVDNLDIEFILDDVPVELMETQVRPVLPHIQGEPLWAINFGHLLSPDALEPGSHTFRLIASDDLGEIIDFTITFFIDPAGSGRCLPENR